MRALQAKSRLSGQALTEFVVMLAMTLGMILALFFFIAVFHEYSWRVMRIIGLEYP